MLYLLDGGINNSVSSNEVVFNPNPDTIKSNQCFGAKQLHGRIRQDAGGVITEETKSGTNTFHGSLFDYLRNTDLDANTFFNKEQPALGLPLIPRPVLIRNQFGGTVGGPVLKDKLSSSSVTRGSARRRRSRVTRGRLHSGGIDGEFFASGQWITRSKRGCLPPGESLLSAKFRTGRPGDNRSRRLRF